MVSGYYTPVMTSAMLNVAILSKFPQMIKLIKQIHDSPYKMILAITGGGSASISELLKVPGASASILEAIVPYHHNSLGDFIGTRVDQSCNPETARKLAMASYKRARHLSEQGSSMNLLGLGCTAALTTNRARRGSVRACLAIQSNRETRESILLFGEAEGDREKEEELVSQFILHNLALACHIQIGKDDSTLTQECSITTAPDNWPDLLGLRLVSTLADTAGKPIFPGAFNPFHQGHRQMIKVAGEKLKQNVFLEVCVNNIDKLPLDYVEMKQRENQLSGEHPLIFTNAPTFVEKSMLFPGSTFVVGTDTVKRIADLKYYGETSRLDHAMTTLKENNIRFLVFGRDTISGLETLEHLNLPDTLRELCASVPEEEFRNDISSTKLRQQQPGNNS